MTPAFVLDCSVTLSWALKVEASAGSVAFLQSLDVGAAFVPALWIYEVVNVLAVSVRRQRLTAGEAEAFLAALAELKIIEDPDSAGMARTALMPLALQHGLTAYDAVYLELAIRLRLPLATHDAKLRNAAAAEGVALLP